MPAGRSHQRLWIDRDQTAWRKFDLIFGCEKVEARSLSIAMMTVSHSIWLSLPSKNAGLKRLF